MGDSILDASQHDELRSRLKNRESYTTIQSEMGLSPAIIAKYAKILDSFIIFLLTVV